MSYRRARLSISPAALSARAHSTTAGAAVGGWCSTAAAAAGRKGWWPSGGVTPPPWCGSCPTWCAPPPCGSGGRAFARDPARRTLRPGGAAIQTLLRDVGGRRMAAFAALLRISPRANAPARPRALPNARARTHTQAITFLSYEEYKVGLRWIGAAAGACVRRARVADAPAARGRGT